MLKETQNSWDVKNEWMNEEINKNQVLKEFLGRNYFFSLFVLDFSLWINL